MSKELSYYRKNEIPWLVSADAQPVQRGWAIKIIVNGFWDLALEHWYGLVTTANELLCNTYIRTLISTKINNFNNIIINTTDIKLIMECQSETPVYI